MQENHGGKKGPGHGSCRLGCPQGHCREALPPPPAPYPRALRQPAPRNPTEDAHCSLRSRSSLLVGEQVPASCFSCAGSSGPRERAGGTLSGPEGPGTTAVTGHCTGLRGAGPRPFTLNLSFMVRLGRVACPPQLPPRPARGSQVRSPPACCFCERASLAVQEAGGGGRRPACSPGLGGMTGRSGHLPSQNLELGSPGLVCRCRSHQSQRTPVLLLRAPAIRGTEVKQGYLQDVGRGAGEGPGVLVVLHLLIWCCDMCTLCVCYA